MRALFKSLPILVIAGALSVSCGDKSNSSGSSSSSSGVSGLPGNTVTQTQSYTSIDQVRSAFASKPMNDGLATGTEIYHMGPYFNSNYSSSGINFQAGFCLQLFGWSAGDCDTQGTSQQDLLLAQLDNGVFKKATASSTTAVSYQEPSGVSNASGYWEYTYDTAQTQSYDRNNSQYKEMLGLDLTSANILDSKVSPATITLSNGQQIAGQILEIVTGYNNYGQQSIQDIRRYVLSTNLPVAANPIAVINGANPVLYGYNGLTALVNGYLAYLGNSSVQGEVQAVQSITINTMNIVQGYGQLQQVQNVVIGF